MSEEGVHPLVLIWVDHQTGPLVRQQDVLILIEDVQLGLVEGQKGVLRGGLVEKLIVDIQLEHVPHIEAHVPLGALPVHLYPLEPDVLLGQRSGEQGQGLGQPAVQPLARVVLSDGKLLHGSVHPPPARNISPYSASVINKICEEIGESTCRG